MRLRGRFSFWSFVEGRCGHHHAGGAEAALEALFGPGTAAARGAALLAAAPDRPGESLDGGDGLALGADGRVDAAVHGGAVDVHGAGTAVAAVAALLDPESCPVRAGTCAGTGRGGVWPGSAVPLISIAMLRPPSAACSVLFRVARSAAATGVRPAGPEIARHGEPFLQQFRTDLLREPEGHVPAPLGQPVDVVVVQLRGNGLPDGGRQCRGASRLAAVNRSCTGRLVAAVTVRTRPPSASRRPISRTPERPRLLSESRRNATCRGQGRRREVDAARAARRVPGLFCPSPVMNVGHRHRAAAAAGAEDGGGAVQPGAERDHGPGRQRGAQVAAHGGHVPDLEGRHEGVAAGAERGPAPGQLALPATSSERSGRA